MTATAAPPAPFDALTDVLARGAEVDVVLVDAIVSGAGRTMRELAAAVTRKTAQCDAAGRQPAATGGTD